MDDRARMSSPTISHKNRCFPPQIIARAVWLYFRFLLSRRLVEDMFPSVASSCLMKRSGDGAANSVWLTQSRWAEGNLREIISGIWTRC